MSLNRVRKQFGVPARRGTPVARMGRKGQKQYGKITGSIGESVSVRWKGHLFSEYGIKPQHLEYFPKRMDVL